MKTTSTVILALLALLLAPTGCMGDRRARVSDTPEDHVSDAIGAHFGVIDVDGRTREFLYVVPESYDDLQPHGVVFAFHGGGGTGERFRAVGLEASAAEHRSVIVYPESAEGRWNDGRGTAAVDVDDVAFVRALLDLLEEDLLIDPDRIFATGASNGGMFSHRLACEVDRFAAVAPVIAALPSNVRDSCAPGRPVSLIAIQGTEDEFITFEGGDAAHDRFPRLGEGGAIESADSTRRFWASVNGCDPEAQAQALPPADDTDPTRVFLYDHQGCADGARVEYYVVEGMGHAWPPLNPAAPRVSGSTSKQLDATALIWAFFARLR